MDIITADWETYYDKDYSLSKLTTEEYVRSPLFEAIMLGLRWPDGTYELIKGTHGEIQYRLDSIEWGKFAVLCHNTMFDAAIFTWRFGVKPRAWLDTLSMARAMHGVKGNSLAALAKRYNLDEKGTAVLNMLGKRRKDMTDQEFKDYADYCLHDVELCYQLWSLMSAGWYDLESCDFRGAYPLEELRLIDQHIRMYTEPVLHLNKDKLKSHLQDVVDRKAALLDSGGIAKDELMSNPKFAAVLESFGVSPPMKISPTTKKLTYAFAKTDPGIKALLEHPDFRVQAAVSARLGVKSTLEETRTQRFIKMVERNLLFPIPLKYSYAKTKRSAGSEGINMQNLPSRGAEGGKLKACIEAPPGHVIINCDSSNIEARMLAWVAGQNDLVQDYHNGVDIYCKTATKFYGREITKDDKLERFVFKTVILGCGYQTGGAKLQITLKASTPSVDVSLETATGFVDAYRAGVPQIVKLWAEAEVALDCIYRDKTMWLGKEGVALVEGKKGIRLPSGLYLSYPELTKYKNDKGYNAWKYKTETGWVDIYGGKVVENCIAEGTPVLTTRGWVPIEQIRGDDLVHDGVEFVKHGGIVSKSVQPCVTIDGVFMTPDHEVLTNDGWIPASQNPRPYRPDLRHVDGVESGTQQRQEMELALPVQLRHAVCQGRGRCNQGDQTRGDTQLRMRNKAVDREGQYHTRDVQTPGIRSLAFNERPMQTTDTPSMEKLRRTGYSGVSRLARIFRGFLGQYGPNLRSWTRFGSHRQRGSVLSGELSVDGSPHECYEQTRHDTRSGCAETQQRDRNFTEHDILQTTTRVVSGSASSGTKPSKQVYDILNAGPRQRFVVRGDSGPFIVHNCIQALARIIVMQQLLKISRRVKVALTVHDSVVTVCREDEADETVRFVESCMRWIPTWAQGCPINCESFVGRNYGEV